MEFCRTQEDRHQLVGAFADLHANVAQSKSPSKLAEDLLPGLRVIIDGVDQGSIDVENYGANHAISSSQTQ
jgi:hypothetical protein